MPVKQDTLQEAIRKRPADPSRQRAQAARLTKMHATQVIKMDELRTFELGPQHTAQALTLGRIATLCAISGPIWITVEGEADDIWLQAGERIDVAAGKRVWLSAEHDHARFTVLTHGHFAKVGARAILAAVVARFTARASSIHSA